MGKKSTPLNEYVKKILCDIGHSRRPHFYAMR
jgi:hypothetical protein